VEMLKQSNLADRKMFKKKETEIDEFPMLTSTEKEVKRLKVILLALLTVDSKK
jgi:hypothetical protein